MKDTVTDQKEWSFGKYASIAIEQNYLKIDKLIFNNARLSGIRHNPHLSPESLATGLKSTAGGGVFCSVFHPLDFLTPAHFGGGSRNLLTEGKISPILAGGHLRRELKEQRLR